MKLKIENRLDELVNQLNDLEDQLIENELKGSEYFDIIGRMMRIRGEKEILINLYKNKLTEKVNVETVQPKEISELEKLKRMKALETKNKMSLVMSLQGDKISIRRTIDELLNYRTKMIKRFIKDVYCVDVDLDSMVINTKTGQYGL